MTFATRLQATTARLVNQFSSDAVLRRESPGAFDPVAGTYAEGMTNAYAIKTTPPKAFNESLIDGTLVQQDDFTVFAAELPVVPDVADSATTDSLDYNGKRYAIVRVTPKSLPDNLTAGYELQCRG